VFTDITDRIRLLFRKDKESYLRFYRILGFYPRNIAVYEQALLHKSSSVKTDKGRLINNERLEFLGDAVLDAVVADIVYRKFEGKTRRIPHQHPFENRAARNAEPHRRRNRTGQIGEIHVATAVAQQLYGR
jgi:dsRNA-specific ribonuclease